MCENEVNQQERQTWESEVLSVNSNLWWNCLGQTKHRWRGIFIKREETVGQTMDLIYLMYFEVKQQEIHWCQEFLLASNQFMGPSAWRMRVSILTLFLLSKSQHIQPFSRNSQHFGEPDLKYKVIWNFQAMPACLWYDLVKGTICGYLTWQLERVTCVVFSLYTGMRPSVS